MIAALALLATAHADVMPPPTRPDWDDPEAPVPDPPQDLELGLMFATAATAAALLAPRRGTRVHGAPRPG